MEAQSARQYQAPRYAIWPDVALWSTKLHPVFSAKVNSAWLLSFKTEKTRNGNAHRRK